MRVRATKSDAGNELFPSLSSIFPPPLLFLLLPKPHPTKMAPSGLGWQPPPPTISSRTPGPTKAFNSHDIVDELLEMDLDDCGGDGGGVSDPLALPLIPNLPLNPLTFCASSGTLFDEGEGKWRMHFFEETSSQASSTPSSSMRALPSHASSTSKTANGRRKYGKKEPMDSSSHPYKMSTARMDLLAKYGVSPTPSSYLPRHGDEGGGGGGGGGGGEKYSSKERAMQSEAMQRQQRQAAKIRNQRKVRTSEQMWRGSAG